MELLKLADETERLDMADVPDPAMRDITPEPLFTIVRETRRLPEPPPGTEIIEG